MELYSHPGETIQSVAAAAQDPGRITDLGGNSPESSQANLNLFEIDLFFL